VPGATFKIETNLFKVAFNVQKIKDLTAATFRHCTQRASGLAQGRGTLMVMRGTNVQFRTKLSAELHPPLCQTAC